MSKATKRKLKDEKVNKKKPKSTSEQYGGRIVKDKKVRGLAGREPFVKPGKKELSQDDE